MKDEFEGIIAEKLRNMNTVEMTALAEDIRQDMIKYVSETGGHLASSLGVVELTIALHRVFDTPEDKIVWDVGHQCYAHKMLTGRWADMDTLRRLGGISGFPKRSESIYDTTDPGHSGTSLSIAHGMASARDLAGDTYSCVAVIGDGAMTSGVAWEALNSIGASKTPLIVVLNDNEMSISRNIGGFSKHLQNLRTSGFYTKFKKNLKKMNTPKGQKRLGSIRDVIKYSMLPRDIFEEIGFKYYGPIDGHDIDSLINMLSFAKDLDRPVLIHILTTKGKGYAPAEEDPTRFHGIGKFDPESGDSGKSAKQSWSGAFGEILLDLAEKDEKICAVTAAMMDSTGLSKMHDKFPERVFDAGIAEQHAVAFAEGLALNGMRPVAAIYSTFLQRAYDQVLTEVCLQDLPVIFAVDRAGATGPDGATHQGIYDIAYLSTIPGMTVMCPRDKETLRNMMEKAFSETSPVAIRYPRGYVPDSFAVPGNGDPEIIKEGRDLIILSDGNMLAEALKAAEILEETLVSGWKKVSVAVADVGTLHPINKEFISDCLERYKFAATLEDGIANGGFGSAVSAFECEMNTGCNIIEIAWPDAFIEHGTIEQLRDRYGMDAKSIAEKISARMGALK